MADATPLVRLKPDRRQSHRTLFGGRRASDPPMPSPHTKGVFSQPHRHNHHSERVLWLLHGTATPTLRCALSASSDGVELRVYHGAELLHTEAFESHPSVTVCAADWHRQFEMKGWRPVPL